MNWNANSLGFALFSPGYQPDNALAAFKQITNLSPKEFGPGEVPGSQRVTGAWSETVAFVVTVMPGRIDVQFVPINGVSPPVLSDVERLFDQLPSMVVDAAAQHDLFTRVAVHNNLVRLLKDRNAAVFLFRDLSGIYDIQPSDTDLQYFINRPYIYNGVKLNRLKRWMTGTIQEFSVHFNPGVPSAAPQAINLWDFLMFATDYNTDPEIPPFDKISAIDYITELMRLSKESWNDKDLTWIS